MSKSLVYFQWPSGIFWHFRLLHLRTGLHFPLCLRLHPGHRPSAWQTTNSQSYQWRSPWEVIFRSSHWGLSSTTNNYWSIGDSEPPERSHCKIWEQRSSKIYLDHLVKIRFTIVTQAIGIWFDYTVKGRGEEFLTKIHRYSFLYFQDYWFFRLRTNSANLNLHLGVPEYHQYCCQHLGWNLEKSRELWGGAIRTGESTVGHYDPSVWCHWYNGTKILQCLIVYIININVFDIE